jgi:hypothetical protein
MVSTDPGRNKVRTRDATVVGWYVMAALLVAACRPDPRTARGTAESFLDAHYVHIDLTSALPFTSGLARHKVESEIGLTQGQSIDESTRKPTVHYTLLEEHPDGDASVNYLYRGSIAIEDADPLERRWLVTVRREGEGWRVTNYQEMTVEPPEERGG